MKSDIRFIRFTRRIARECSAGNRRLAELAVCDTIANGTRLSTGRRGTRGGAIIRFERDFSPAPRAKRCPLRARKATVAVLAELVPHGCVALRLISTAPGRRINWNDLGFLNRAGAK
jgi:hypothetical protein